MSRTSFSSCSFKMATNSALRMFHTNTRPSTVGERTYRPLVVSFSSQMLESYLKRQPRIQRPYSSCSKVLISSNLNFPRPVSGKINFLKWQALGWITNKCENCQCHSYFFHLHSRAPHPSSTGSIRLILSAFPWIPRILHNHTDRYKDSEMFGRAVTWE